MVGAWVIDTWLQYVRCLVLSARSASKVVGKVLSDQTQDKLKQEGMCFPQGYFTHSGQGARLLLGATFPLTYLR